MFFMFVELQLMCSIYPDEGQLLCSVHLERLLTCQTFLETATRYPVVALQRFGLVKTPAPPWVAIHRVCIPQRTLVHSAEYLVKALGGEEMAYKIAGGTKWWQVRAGPGVEGEWVVLKKDWKDYQKAKEGSMRDKDKDTKKSKKGKGKEKEMEQEPATRRDEDEIEDSDGECESVVYQNEGRDL
jgi:hypothetical protein